MHIKKLRKELFNTNWYGFAALKTGISLDKAYYEHKLIIEGLKARNLRQTTDAVLNHLDHTYTHNNSKS